MNLDDLLFRYFGSAGLAGASFETRAAGLERIRVDFGLEKDRGKRFALWSLLYLLGSAPALDVAFKEEGDCEAARRFMDLLAAADEGSR